MGGIVAEPAALGFCCQLVLDLKDVKNKI